MKRTIFVFGGIAGLVVGLFISFFTLMWTKNLDYGNGWITGYAAQVIAFSFIFVGVKNFRDKFNQGSVSFGKALTIGLGITLIASTIYVLIWLVDYYTFMPDFMDKYSVHLLKEARDSGLGQAALDKKIVQINGMKEMYKNPLFVVLFTYAEIVPIGVIISLLTALILKRRRPRAAVA